MAKGMTKTEALEKIKELEYHIKNKKKDILVPDCIKIEGKMGKSDSLGIVFNEGRQTLYGNSIRDTFVWFVNPTYRSYYVKAKLVEVDVKDLEPGQLYFHTDNNEVADSELEDINFYAIYLGDGKYAKTNGDVMLYNVERSHWYKVVEITE